MTSIDTVYGAEAGTFDSTSVKHLRLERTSPLQPIAVRNCKELSTVVL
eukprot:CAMPEP_0174874404 /NCGR_PEP_ID=MMETSP1114-20130205/76629_1 /TAXON_ID=312471 /ORGANISM="Neobodo designis, Strain CCAP 1951/1" /LENGTH=47 /DNA_ID= /DNA_START= /DNA_END= /DNA_ORIENTATION=